MYYDIMASRITKLVLVPIEEWKRINKNGGDMYTTVNIPSFNNPTPNQEGKGKNTKNKMLFLLLQLLLILLCGMRRNQVHPLLLLLFLLLHLLGKGKWKGIGGELE